MRQQTDSSGRRILVVETDQDAEFARLLEACGGDVKAAAAQLLERTASAAMKPSFFGHSPLCRMPLIAYVGTEMEKDSPDVRRPIMATKV